MILEKITLTFSFVKLFYNVKIYVIGNVKLKVQKLKRISCSIDKGIYK